MLPLVNMRLAERLLLIRQPTRLVVCIIPEESGAKKLLHLQPKHLFRMQVIGKAFVPAVSVVGLA